MTLAFVFPGQGSQEVGMLGELLSVPLVAACFAEADAVLGMPLSRIVRDGPEEELNRTAVTQPALLTASVALWRLWQARQGALPSVLAGHSLGEYSALVAAEALTFADAVRLVHTRGLLMQEAVPPGAGAMAAILGLDDKTVAECCTATDGIVSAANFNAPGQVVIAGASAAVDSAIERCKAAGAKRAIRLAVSVPSHCALMQGAADKFAATLEKVAFAPPSIPVIHNLDAEVSATPAALREKLIGQLSQPVRWTACIARMTERRVTTIVECGPGKVLGGLIKRIDKGIRVFASNDPNSFDEALASGAT